MTVLFDNDISGDGISDLVGSNHVLFWECHLTALGGDVRELEVTAPDHILRAGWVSLGDRFTIGTGPFLDRWRQPVQLNFLETLWTPIPSDSPGGSLSVLATRVRWHLSPGTLGHLFVFGP